MVDGMGGVPLSESNGKTGNSERRNKNRQRRTRWEKGSGGCGAPFKN
jgi:hypothetical protein